MCVYTLCQACTNIVNTVAKNNQNEKPKPKAINFYLLDMGVWVRVSDRGLRICLSEFLGSADFSSPSFRLCKVVKWEPEDIWKSHFKCV